MAEVSPTAMVDGAVSDATAAESILHESGSIFNRITADMVEILIYMICLTIGGPLNLFSFHRLIRNYRSGASSQINVLRLHLNIADLLTLFVFVLSQIIWMTTYQWYGGDLLCRICKFFHTFSFYLNSFVVACIAIDRVFGTYHLNSVKASQLAHRRCRRMLSVAWICAFVFSIPQVFIFRVFHPPEMRNFKQCTPIWTIVAYEVELALKNANMTLDLEKELVAEYYQIVRLEKIYGILHLLFIFYAPACIILFSYGAIICKLNSLAGAPSTGRGADGARRGCRSSLASCCGLLGLLPLKERGCSLRENGSFASASSPFPVARLVPLPDRQPPTSPTGSEKHQVDLCSVPSRQRMVSDNDQSASNSVVDSRRSSLRRSARSATKMGPLALHTLMRASQLAKRQGALILLAYLTFWSPYNILAVVNAFASEGESREFASVTLTFLNSLLVVNTIANPLIYAMRP
ncbi:hypothetical protein QR680_016724 [Steinernema hermaphroditum]|uniref:G-protein coupled receptors family 1 profile domain-containing protein n=1 Tax=Steinernema hermaphroditum TaxID=289476 RepID=A0AA39HC53_9BILA|nr:hypothetical protein QR680_016724 [Steinernema hermaphroditum]